MDEKITITKTIGRGTELLADEGLVLHNKVTGQWLSRRAMIFDAPEDYEALEEPKYTREQYEEKVSKVAAEYESYYNYCEECKVRATEILSEPIVEQIEEEGNEDADA